MMKRKSKQTKINDFLFQSHSDALLLAIELLYNLEQTNTSIYLSPTANLFPLSNH